MRSRRILGHPAASCHSVLVGGVMRSSIHRNPFLHGARRHNQINLWQAISERLRIVRIALGLSEKEAAEAFGVTLRTYRRYEAGGAVPGKHWLRFCDRYRISVNWLLLGDGRGLGPHLARRGKVAILPVINSYRRSQRDDGDPIHAA